MIIKNGMLAPAADGGTLHVRSATPGEGLCEATLVEPSADEIPSLAALPLCAGCLAEVEDLIRGSRLAAAP